MREPERAESAENGGVQREELEKGIVLLSHNRTLQSERWM